MSTGAPYVADISTHALTEGDKSRYSSYSAAVYFNSRPHGGRQYGAITKEIIHYISTHALTEGDICTGIVSGISILFQLTPSRRATDTVRSCLFRLHISTHALTEGDAICRI